VRLSRIARLDIQLLKPVAQKTHYERDSICDEYNSPQIPVKYGKRLSILLWGISRMSPKGFPVIVAKGFSDERPKQPRLTDMAIRAASRGNLLGTKSEETETKVCVATACE
jgi:hypothetical protein